MRSLKRLPLSFSLVYPTLIAALLGLAIIGERFISFTVPWYTPAPESVSPSDVPELAVPPLVR